MSDSLTLSVGVSTFNRNDDLFRCLEALTKQTFSDFDIVIANGGDYEGVKEVAGRFKNLRIKIVNQQRKGLVEARNLGWRCSSADIVCLIDDDLIVHPQWLEEVRKTFLLDKKIGGVSGPTIIPRERRCYRDFASLLDKFKTSKNILVRIIGKIYTNLVLEGKIHNVGKILDSGAFTPGSNYEDCLEIPDLVEVDYLEACHMCFRRDIFEEIGGFDYTYLGTGEWEEPDFSFRARDRGYRLVFNPKAITEHHISQGGVFKNRTQAYERSRNFIYFYFRNIKPNTINKALRFGSNLFFINGYWVYKFIETKNPDWLSGIRGSLAGLAKELWQ